MAVLSLSKTEAYQAEPSRSNNLSTPCFSTASKIGLSELIKNINFPEENRIVLADEFNVFFDRKLETKQVKPSLRQKSIAKT